MTEDSEGGEPKKTKSAMVMTIVAIAVLTIIGGGGGFMVGGMLSSKVQPPLDPAKGETPAKGESQAAPSSTATKDEGLARISTEENGVVQLEPITSNLAFPTESWVRLEVALLFKGKPDVKLAEDIHQDILGYLRTVTLQQIEGPRGFLYLKEDLQDRVDLISEGKVSKIMFRTFVIE